MFWGAEVQFNKPFIPVAEEYANLHLRNVSVLWCNEKLSLACTVKKRHVEGAEEQEFVICHLDGERVKQHTVNYFFDLTNEEITFTVRGKGKVCLVGSLEAKEGKALTNDLVKNLAPKIADAKKKMLLDLFSLVKDSSQGDENGEVSDDDDEYNGEEDSDDEEEEVEPITAKQQQKQPQKTKVIQKENKELSKALPASILKTSKYAANKSQTNKQAIDDDDEFKAL